MYKTSISHNILNGKKTYYRKVLSSYKIYMSRNCYIEAVGYIIKHIYF